MKLITISMILQWAYGPDSTLKEMRTWRGRPKYSVDVILNALARAEGFKAILYPNGKIRSLYGPEGLSQSDIETIVLQPTPG